MCSLLPASGALIVAVNSTVSFGFSCLAFSGSDAVMPSTTLPPSVVILSVTLTLNTGRSPVFVTS
ncbi:hypothetical protein CXF46_04315 [Corynebacterium bovis]|nr:hypothetical protein CXF38_07950 [Corynebacterium bovis]RRO83350.1 hypothetical protein CXF36_03290 [Corynebacterium bovis]RRO84510.1 hypothetical protein CXF37_03045 [Corynebacterium bovis]RRQ17185.1 hypothetical protein CXF46_04315 [Corynebacterium bovis]